MLFSRSFSSWKITGRFILEIFVHQAPTKHVTGKIFHMEINFQIDLDYMRMEKGDVFGGLENECPLKHLERFNKTFDLIFTCPNSLDCAKKHLFLKLRYAEE